MNWHHFAHHLSQQLEMEIKISSASAVHGGDINQTYHLETSIGPLFIKFNDQRYLGMMQAEANSLQKILDTQTLRCPKPFATGQYHDYAWLVMESLPISHATQNDVCRGILLAKLHQHHSKHPQPFGWFEDNFIGKTPQKNTWHSTWPKFYGEQRLRPQLDLAEANGASTKLLNLGSALIDQLEFWFQDYQPAPSLLHGDLWGGNSAFLKDGTPVIYDPASYYGDRETDLAMTELFGGFSANFYRGYQQHSPLDRGYSSRKALYTLYHLLNHFNLFGGHYQSQAQGEIEKLLAQVK